VNTLKQRPQGWKISPLCALFGNTRQALSQSNRRHQRRGVDAEIVLEYVRQRRATQPCEGTRKLYEAIRPLMQSSEIKMGRDKLFALLRSRGMLVKRRRRRHVTTDSSHAFRKYPNLVKGREITHPEQVVVGDITYVLVNKTFAYLSLIMDAYSHLILGYHLDRSLQSHGCIQALRMALHNRHYPSNTLIHHTDRGRQYCCGDYISLLKKHHIDISMTEQGDPSENAMAERLNGILKTELAMDADFDNLEQARQTLRQSVLIYNRHRLHASCDYLTPYQAHQRHGVLKKRWKRYPRHQQNIKKTQTTV
jgi:transposase InsO family protein